MPFFKSGQLVPLAVTSAQRSPLMPEVPTIVELGQPKLVLENFFGLSGPAQLPAPVVAKLHAACNEVLVMPEIQKKLAELGIMRQAGIGGHVQRLGEGSGGRPRAHGQGRRHQTLGTP